MPKAAPSIAQCAVVATALKLLLLPAYKSTDFEVHRNWLAITNSLPMQEWYYEKTSEWTLDYPPFFAYFEWILSQAARFVEPDMLDVGALAYDNWQTVYFQRATVILTELVLVYALHLYVSTSTSKRTAQVSALSVLLSPGLLIIDHIHFQYNGFLYGVLILSIVLARQRSTLLPSGLLFAALLCLKHIYLYLAPAYFVFLLRTYCLSPRSIFWIQFWNCVKLGAGLGLIFIAAFGPFAYWGQMPQVMSRLFPFSRGLCHAYWAPNVWAMYSFSDRVLIYLAPYLGIPVDQAAINSVTRGLVGDTSFAVLPEVPPKATFVLTLFFQIIPLIKLFLHPSWNTFVGALTLCAYASFLFGWHVHEKAILLVLIPFSLLALLDRRHLGAFRPLAVAGHVSLFPLLFTAAEFPIKTVYTVFWLVTFLLAFDQMAPPSENVRRVFFLDRFSLLYVAVSIPLVQYKRKPVQRLQDPLPRASTEIWVIRQTDEIFTDYESYLKRLDFYRQKKFTCDITGHSGLTFFEALESEMEGTLNVNNTFPDSLRDPVLRHVQFSIISRIDDLVNHVYEHFKQDFYPGERIIALTDDGDRREGVVREKAQMAQFGNPHVPGFNSPDRFFNKPSFTRYFIALDTDPTKFESIDSEHLTRDRKVFTKQILRSFLKNSLTRESWSGAPWCVKENLARELKLPTEIPPELRQNAKIAERKASAQIKKDQSDGSFLKFLANTTSQQRAPNSILNAVQLPKGGQLNFQLSDMPTRQQPNAANQQQFKLWQPQHNHQGRLMSWSAQPQPVSAHLPVLMQPPQPTTAQFHQYGGYPTIASRPKPTPHPEVKYPIDDLELAPKNNGMTRPKLKFIAERPPHKSDKDKKSEVNGTISGLKMKSVGMLLEVWNTLNVHQEVFEIDSFTVDDFIEAMSFSAEDVECELFNEVHCAVLNCLLDEDGEICESVRKELPEMEEEELEEEEDAKEEPTPEPEPRPVRTTRSSIVKSEAAALEAQARRDSQALEKQAKQVHRAAEMMQGYDWVERLQKHDLRDGGWQAIVVGLLHQISLDPARKEPCERVLEQLAPPDLEPTQETALTQYQILDVNLRIQALQIITMLTIYTDALRRYIEEQAQEMTNVRREKGEWQKTKKQRIDELRTLDEQRKILLPDNMPQSPQSEQKPQGDKQGDTKMSGVEGSPEPDHGSNDESDDDESDRPRRSLRGGAMRENERKRKREEELARKEKEKAEAAKPKQSAQFKKLLRDIDKKKDEIKRCEDKIAELENDLRETDCNRTRLLGKDRFFNRYWFFERNGMPYGGVPTSSTAHYNYSSGRIWIQGPDHLETTGFLDLAGKQSDQYKATMGVTVQERKEIEEGSTHLNSSTEWAYIDDPDAIDQLIAWLDDRGDRERHLRKELQNWRKPIADCLKARHAHLDAVAEKLGDGAADDKAADDVPTTARAVLTRNKTYVDPDKTPYQCLLWHNSYAVEKHGHIHSDPPRPRKQSKKAAQAAADKAEKERKERERSKAPASKAGKPVTRHATRSGKA
ncbi:ALG6, ALG8 glycosyltransferase family-domain-containing protein [Lineolata rhizophorae]|uniref:ALG6, ALG8 glycosyltransferase family-domain-containing protein n=1 Tax=Lineolata rhizophorae TaxID=578093 RepID=A0A6A6NYF9_9PEZI|nr:ALG6, ALG8 glycosyltransferase family-domain-containing protein [Lineolata rhizophorae]